MFLFFFAMGLTIAAGIFYHVFQKSISSSVNPAVSLVITYATALAVSLLLLPFFRIKTTFWTAIKEANYASYALAFGIVGLEFGFLLAYRAGWNVSLAAVVSNVALTILLIPIGLIFFREHLTMANLAGIALCLLGLWLISWK